MVKVKNKKRNTAENVNAKKDANSKKTLNPFEVHINKEKIRVLGRKLKNDRGLPGIARAKALQKRKHTLLPEYQVQNKSNKFTDRRIGERNKGFTSEDKTMARYTAVRVKQHNKKSIFNLADDEILTHKGQTLSEIEKFDDPRSDDEDLDSLDGKQQTGHLDRKFVEDVHFGGGMLTKKSDGHKSHKDLIDQLIAESKKRKVEKQRQKEATLELTEKLDTEWKDLLPIVSKSKKGKEDEVGVAKPPVDAYDKVMRELKFEARGTPSDKLKTEDEIAKEDKEKLEKLERERLERMKGITPESKRAASNHRSADDLDDNFAYDSDEEPDVTLSYNEGKSNFDLQNGDSQNGTNSDEEEEAEDEEDEVETDSEDNLSDLKDSDAEDVSDGEIELGAEDSQEDGEDLDGNEVVEDEDEKDNESSEEESEDSEVDNEDKEDFKISAVESKAVKKVVTKKSNDAEVNGASSSDEGNYIKMATHKRKIAVEDDDGGKRLKLDAEKIKEDLLQRKEMMEQARNELPYTYSLPESYESLQETLKGQSGSHQGVIIERMIKCNHPSLKEGNKDALGMLFVYLLQHVTDICGDATDEAGMKESFRVFSCLVPQFFDLAQLNPENANASILEVIKEKHGDFSGVNSKFPGVDVLMYLKLVSCLFSTSDFRHRVVVPCLAFMEHMLMRCKVRTRRDVAYGLFLVALVAEYTTLSKRYMPAAIRFLTGVLHMAVPKSSVQLLKVLPPFKPTATSLILSKPTTTEADLKLDPSELATSRNFDDTFRIKSTHTTISLLKHFYTTLQTISSCPEVFETAELYLSKLPMKSYPSITGKTAGDLLQSLREFKTHRKLEYIVMAKKRPKALRLYEPNVQKVYDGKRFKVQSKEKAERDKLLHKIKKEKKGALREIRRDKAFLGRLKIGKQIRSDMERKEKVKRIYSEASVQQSELNTLDRAKKKK